MSSPGEWMVLDLGTTVVGVLGVIVTLAWIVGKSVDIEPVDPRACLKECRVSPGSIPKWVRKAVFARYPSIQFYDWSKLDPDEWQRLHGAIRDYYDQLFAQSLPILDPESSIDDLVHAYAMIGASDVHEFEAGVRVLLLMIYDKDIFNAFNRHDQYMKKVTFHVERYNPTIVTQ